jgi:hypothetical protein
MAGALTTKPPPLRNHIAMNKELEVKYWTKHLGVSREALQRAVDKVGNSAAAVRKELGKNEDGQSRETQRNYDDVKAGEDEA